MCSYGVKEIIPVVNKKSWFAERLQVIDEIIGGNVFHGRSAGIKNFTHPYLILRAKRLADLVNKIIPQKSCRSITMWLKPGDHLWRNRLTGPDSRRTFHRVMRKIIYYPHTVFITQYLRTAIYAFIFF